MQGARLQRHERFFLAGLIAILTGMINYFYAVYFYENPPDFFWPLYGGRALLMGQEPYTPALYPYESLFYPLMTIMVAMPFNAFPDYVASALFFAISSGLMAYALLLRYEPWRLLIFLTPAYYEALRVTQWPPLFMLVVLLPSTLPLILIKPQLGLSLTLPTLPRHLTRTGIVATLLFIVASFVVYPLWPLAWLREVDYSGQIPFLILPFGPLMALALLRWRDFEGRLLFFMAILPKRVFYDQLALWLIPRNKREFAFLTVVGWVGYIGWFVTKDWLHWPEWMVAWTYLPALLVLLWPRVRDWLRRASGSV